MTCDMQKVKAEVEKNYQTFIDEEGPFGGGGWHLWDFCSYFFELDTFEEYKEAFFYALRRLLDEGRVKLIRPDVDVLVHYGKPPASGLTINDLETHWDAPTDEIIAWLRERWPEKAKDTHDVELNSWFFTIPPLAWKGKDGMWHGS